MLLGKPAVKKGTFNHQLVLLPKPTAKLAFYPNKTFHSPVCHLHMWLCACVRWRTPPSARNQMKAHIWSTVRVYCCNSESSQKLLSPFPESRFLCAAASPPSPEKEKMKLNVCVHFIMSAIAFWKLQVAECLTFSCQASSCWDNKCLSSFAHSGSCRLQTAGARRSLNTIPIRMPVLVPPLCLASPHARNPLLSNIYTQLEWQMYRNFTHTLSPHLEPACIFFSVFLSFGRGDSVVLTQTGEREG